MLKKMTEQHGFSQWTLAQEPEFVKALLEVKEACAIANGKAGLIPAETAKAISQACADLGNNISNKTFFIDLLQGGGGIAINLNLNQALCDHSPQLTAEACNASQSTADVVSSAVRVTLIRELFRLEQVLLETQQTLMAKAAEFAEVPTLARTCLQDALVTSLGRKFSGYAQPLKRGLESLAEQRQVLHGVSLGGTVIGDGQGATAPYRQQVIGELATLTGLKLRPRESFMDAAQNIDEIVRVSHELALLAESCIKMGKDLRWLHSGPRGGLGEITLPKLLSGSSFFADKNNPTLVETLLQCCFEVLGNDRSVGACLEHGELDLNVFESMAGLKTMRSAQFLTRALHNFTQYALKDVQANTERCRQLSKFAGAAKGVKSDEGETS